MIEAKGLSKYYGPIVAVEDVSFRIEQGEIVGFLGPNGAGKTTTMRVLTGFTPASRGIAKVAGYHVEDAPLEVKRRVGYLPESVPLYPEMLVTSYLKYVAEIKGVSRDERQREIGRVMERCGLEDMGKRVVGNLSKGYRQRVGLAQALIGDPPVLILDEPTEGLDPRQIIEIRRLIKGLAEGHTVLLSTHILPEISLICQRVLIINRGRLVAEDTMANLAGTADGTTVLEIDVLGSEETVRQALEILPEVTEVAREPSGTFLVRCTGDPDPREAVARALAGAACTVLALKQRARTLEEVFVEVVSRDEGREE